MKKKAPVKKQNLRKVLIYKPGKPVCMGRIKKGDVFTVLPADKGDKECLRGLQRATTKAKKRKGKGLYEVYAINLEKIKLK